MAHSVLKEERFQNEGAAFAFVEAVLWPDGPVCHHCGNCDPKRIKKMEGRTTRRSLYNCRECRKPFTVRMGTILEDSHLPLHLWLQIIHLMCASKKGVSTRQVQRMLQCSMKTAWHLTHRIREGMRDGSLAPMGGPGKTVEIDETVQGKIEGAPKLPRGKRKVLGGFSGFRNVALTLVERGGRARSFHVTGTTIAELKPVILANIKRETAIMTDQATWYPEIGREFASHETVNHGREEYVRYDGDRVITTNAVEGYYSVFKRGMVGVYQWCSERHLHRYLAEFVFRFSNREKLGIDDIARAEIALRGFVGKRLTYRTTCH
jgi:transposase-like protein